MTAKIISMDDIGWWNRHDCGYEFMIDEATVTLNGVKTTVEGTLFFFPNRDPKIQVRFSTFGQRDYYILDAKAKQEIIDAAMPIVGKRIQQLSSKR